MGWNERKRKLSVLSNPKDTARLVRFRHSKLAEPTSKNKEHREQRSTPERRDKVEILNPSSLRVMAPAAGAAPAAGGQASPGEVRDGGGPSTKRIRPCQRCQKLKVKCERSPDGGPCRRCHAKKKECTYEEVSNKKRKKNPDEYKANHCQNPLTVDGLTSWRKP